MVLIGSISRIKARKKKEKQKKQLGMPLIHLLDDEVSERGKHPLYLELSNGRIIYTFKLRKTHDGKLARKKELSGSALGPFYDAATRERLSSEEAKIIRHLLDKELHRKRRILRVLKGQGKKKKKE